MKKNKTMKKRRVVVFTSGLLLFAFFVGCIAAEKPVAHDVFGFFDKMHQQVCEERDQQIQAFDELLESLEEGTDEYQMILEEQGELVMGIDIDRQTRKRYERIMEAKADIGQTDGPMELSQIAVLGREVLLGFAAPLDCAFEEEVTLLISGMPHEGTKVEVEGAETTETEHYRYYRCEMISSPPSSSLLPKTTLITVENGEYRFCFRYTWADRTVELPRNERMREKWFSESKELNDAWQDKNTTAGKRE